MAPMVNCAQIHNQKIAAIAYRSLSSTLYVTEKPQTKLLSLLHRIALWAHY